MKNPIYLKDKEVLIIGSGKSGIATAKLLLKLGSLVTIYDQQEIQHSNDIKELIAEGVNLFTGSPELSLLKNKELVIKNPGVPYTNPLVKEAISLHIEVITEIELAYRLNSSFLIAITGTNGKTSTTTWIGKALDKDNIPNKVIGNIGVPFSQVVLDAQPHEVLVLELSSFQLKGIKDFRPNISVLLNINDAHLDYHGNRKDYIDSKKNIIANQTPLDIVVYNYDDLVIRSLVQNSLTPKIPFSTKEELDHGVFVKRSKTSNKIIYKNKCGTETVIKSDLTIGVPGEHFLSNSLAVVAVSKILGLKTESISASLEEFKGLPHRLELIREVNGVKYYNDSKSTNFVSTQKALEGFKDKSIILIAGGLDRGDDFMDLVPLIKQKVKALISIGENKEKLNDIATLADIPYRSVHSSDKYLTLRNAIKETKDFLEPDDVVLFSPASASWDLYDSFEQRGNILKEIILHL